jgi:ribosome-binding protein aMBF1 (putative translation factor)
MSRIRTTSKRKGTNRRSDRVILSRLEYERLLAKAGEEAAGDGPEFPKPDARGNFPAVEYLRASIARELIRRRRAAGLSQMELAKRAGVRQETISRIESGKHTVTEAVMAKIEAALSDGSSRRGRSGRRKKHAA